MRIAICSDQYLPLLSGLVDSIETLTHELRREGHEVRIYAPTLPGAVPEEHVYRFPSWTLPGSGNAMIVALPLGALKDMRTFKPDIIHTHLAGITGIFAIYASFRLSVPLIGTDHTFPADYLHYAKLNWPPFPYLVRKFSAWYYNRCAFVTTPGREILEELRAYGMKKPARIISNPLQTYLFRPLSEKGNLKKKLRIGERAVLIFGRIAKEKNLDFALSIFAQLSSETELVFVGDGPYREHIEKRVNELQIRSRVRFLGVLRGESLVEAVNACEVCLITSTGETQSLSTLQSLACGLPVVAANIGGPAEYIRDGETGYLVDPEDAETFVARLTKILNEPYTATRLGQQARQSVEIFSPERITAEFEAAYRSTIESK